MEEGNDCVLCFESFNEKLRPRVLPCGHSFCHPCLIHLFRNGGLTCPTCKQEHHAANEEAFPINYGMEKVISNSKKAEASVSPKAEASVAPKAILGPKSKRMQTLIDEQRSSTQNLLLLSDELESQMKEYDDFLVDKKSNHEEVLQKINQLANRNEVIIKKIIDERQGLTEMQNEVIGVKKELKEKLTSLDDANDTKTAIAAIDELDQSFALLEEWNERCQQFPNANIVTFSNKVLIESKAALSMVDSESNENVPEIPDLSNTNFTILEKVSKICRNCTLSSEKFRNMSQQIKNLVKEGRVYAIQLKEGNIRSARLSLKEDLLYMHCLQDGEPPAHVHTIKLGEVLNAVNVKVSKEVFMDLSWEGSFRGRVRILLFTDTPLARQFRMLCTGELGPSYAHSTFLGVNQDNTVAELVYAGDYEYSDGTGGASIVEGTESINSLNRHTYVEGIVWTSWQLDDKSRSAQFCILTGKGKPLETLNRVFGKVEHGLELVKSTVKLADIKSVEIIDCGVVIPL